MEISIGLYATIFIFFFLIVPGFVCRRFYYHGEFSKQINISINSIIHLLSALFIGIALTLSFIALHNLFASNRINIDDVLNSFDKEFIDKAPEINKNKFEGLSTTIYNSYLKYLGAIYSFAAIIGFYASKVVLFMGLDTKFKFFRFRNEWHYLFSGKILKFKPIRNSVNHQKLKVKYTYLDILVAEKGDETTLYSGLFGDYEINPSEPCKLEKIHLLKAHRYKKILDDNNNVAYEDKPIPGKLFTILGEKILNINCTYIFFDEDKNRKFKKLKSVLITVQIFSLIIFLSILISFLFTINFFGFDWYTSVLSQKYLTKLLILLSLNFFIGLITPFIIDKEKKEIKFIGWRPILAKLILISLFGFWIYAIYQ